MTDEQKPNPAIYIAIFMPVIMSGIFAGRNDTSLFGLSGDFLAGFLMTVGLCGLLAAVALSVRRVE